MTADQLRAEVASIDWWHTIDLGGGVVTPGRGGSPALLERIHMPRDLRGKSVLDIGAFDGAFSFEAERRGAARVVALDHRVPRGFELASQVLDSRVEFQLQDVMTLTPDQPGVFDVVLFLGVIYHLPNPMAALQRVYDVTGELMILETDGSMDWIPFPAAECVGSREAYQNSALNWWLPNVPCLVKMVEAVGFSRVDVVFGPRPAPRTLAGRALRKLLPSVYAPKSSRIVVHAWK